MSRTALGLKIKELRERANLSQADLARLIGVHPSYLGHVETGRIKLPSKDILSAMGRALDTQPETLLRAAGYLPAGAPAEPNLDLADPDLKLALAALAEATPDDQRKIARAILAFLNEEDGTRKRGP